jgi:hypothetical protein
LWTARATSTVVGLAIMLAGSTLLPAKPPTSTPTCSTAWTQPGLLAPATRHTAATRASAAPVARRRRDALLLHQLAQGPRVETRLREDGSGAWCGRSRAGTKPRAAGSVRPAPALPCVAWPANTGATGKARSRSARPSTRNLTPGRPRCSRSRKGTATVRSRSSRASSTRRSTSGSGWPRRSPSSRPTRTPLHEHR